MLQHARKLTVALIAATLLVLCLPRSIMQDDQKEMKDEETSQFPTSRTNTLPVAPSLPPFATLPLAPISLHWAPTQCIAEWERPPLVVPGGNATLMPNWTSTAQVADSKQCFLHRSGRWGHRLSSELLAHAAQEAMNGSDCPVRMLRNMDDATLMDASCNQANPIVASRCVLRDVESSGGAALGVLRRWGHRKKRGSAPTQLVFMGGDLMLGAFMSLVNSIVRGGGSRGASLVRPARVVGATYRVLRDGSDHLDFSELTMMGGVEALKKSAKDDRLLLEAVFVPLKDVSIPGSMTPPPVLNYLGHESFHPSVVVTDMTSLRTPSPNIPQASEYYAAHMSEMKAIVDRAQERYASRKELSPLAWFALLPADYETEFGFEYTWKIFLKDKLKELAAGRSAVHVLPLDLALVAHRSCPDMPATDTTDMQCSVSPDGDSVNLDVTTHSHAKDTAVDVMYRRAQEGKVVKGTHDHSGMCRDVGYRSMWKWALNTLWRMQDVPSIDASGSKTLTFETPVWRSGVCHSATAAAFVKACEQHPERSHCALRSTVGGEKNSDALCTVWKDGRWVSPVAKATAKPLLSTTNRCSGKVLSEVQNVSFSSDLQPVLEGCQFHTFSREEALAVLQRTRTDGPPTILFKGDSTVRNMFMRLVSFLRGEPVAFEHYFHGDVTYEVRISGDTLVVLHGRVPIHHLKSHVSRDESPEGTLLLLLVFSWDAYGASARDDMAKVFNPDVIWGGFGYWTLEPELKDPLMSLKAWSEPKFVGNASYLVHLTMLLDDLRVIPKRNVGIRAWGKEEVQEGPKRIVTDQAAIFATAKSVLEPIMRDGRHSLCNFKPKLPLAAVEASVTRGGSCRDERNMLLLQWGLNQLFLYSRNFILDDLLEKQTKNVLTVGSAHDHHQTPSTCLESTLWCFRTYVTAMRRSSPKIESNL